MCYVSILNCEAIPTLWQVTAVADPRRPVAGNLHRLHHRPATHRNNKVVYDAILVIVDRFLKMSFYIPAEKTWKAEDLADSFIERVISRFRVPKGIVSDRGSVFISRMWAEICTIIKQRRRLSTAFHPQTDGQTEQQNQNLET